MLVAELMDVPDNGDPERHKQRQHGDQRRHCTARSTQQTDEKTRAPEWTVESIEYQARARG